ncbi:WD40-repeat-containing domain protein [Flagelloscypha sp. PMI_526]|nr:WD40-repeat-containing domain protein [Flagelloscypha sp. PMI_526]
MAPRTTISAEEINLLVHAYLQDSGFVHAAFSFAAESKLSSSPLFSKPIERGQLVEHLIKALRYMEVETHCRGQILNESCQAPFTLLSRHECSPDAKPAPAFRVVPELLGSTRIGNADTETLLNNQKNLSSMSQMVKPRQGHDANAMEIDSPSKGSLAPPVKVTASTPAPVLSTAAGIVRTNNGRTVPKHGAKSKVINFPTMHESEVFAAAWSAQFRDVFATGTRDGKVRIWQIPAEHTSPRPPVEFALDIKSGKQGDITGIAFHPTEKVLTIASYDSVLRTYDTSGKPLWQGTAHTGPIFALKWHPTKNVLITASLDGCVGLWSNQTGRLVRMYKLFKGQCCDVEWLDDNHFATAGGSNGSIQIMHMDREGVVHTLAPAGFELTLIRRHGNYLAAACDNGTARLFVMNRPLTEAPPVTSHVLRGHTKGLSGLRWNPVQKPYENPTIATGDFEGNVILWDAVTGTIVHRFKDQKMPIFVLTFSPDGRYLSIGGQLGVLMFYDTKTMKKVWEWGSGNGLCLFEAEWQTDDEGKVRWIALALSNKKCVVIEVANVPELYP